MAALSGDVLLSRLPIIVILGATGTGKSKLGLQIAKKFNGEIISADSMQVYKGLDIVTNKVTKEEQNQAKHYLLDFLNPNQLYSVVDFRDQALPIIEDLLRRGKLPVVVGGTNYYIESLLWKVLVQAARGDSLVSQRNSGKRALGDDSDDDGATKRVKCDNVTGSARADDASGLFEKLRRVDPQRAVELHPNNVRKIIRSLEVFQQTGRRHSELLAEQRAAGGSQLGGPLRFPDTLIFWIQSDQKPLEQRLDSRVDAMIQEGLIEELLDFHRRYNLLRMKENEAPDYTKGIFQSIGFKEFHEYLMLDEEARKSEKGIKLLQEGIEMMKTVTRQYSRRQIKWIRNRMLSRPEDQAVPVYALNASDVSLWQQNVYEPAVKVIDCFVKSISCEIKPLPLIRKPSQEDPASLYGHHLCDTCGRTFVGDLQWESHLRSKKHQRVKKKKEREEGLKKVQEDKTNQCN